MEAGTHAANNLAGAQYLDSLASEMQAVTRQYQSKIGSERREIDRLQKAITAAQRPHQPLPLR